MNNLRDKIRCLYLEALGNTKRFVSDNGLVAHYPFNGNANDESGNGNDGTVYGNVALTTDRFGNANSAYLFTQQTTSFVPPDYIEVNDDNSLDFTTAYSISLWFNQFTLNSHGRGYNLVNKITPVPVTGIILIRTIM